MSDPAVMAAWLWSVVVCAVFVLVCVTMLHGYREQIDEVHSGVDDLHDILTDLTNALTCDYNAELWDDEGDGLTTDESAGEPPPEPAPER